MHWKNGLEKLKKVNWFLVVGLLLAGFLISETVEFTVDRDKIKSWISAEPANLPLVISEKSEDMVGITIYYPSGKSRRVVVTVSDRDEIIERQNRDQDISDLLPKENNEGF